MYILKEKYFDSFRLIPYSSTSSIDLNLYKNPSSKEAIKNIADGARGYISPDGDLYLEGYDDPYETSKIIHQDLRILSTKPGIPSKEYFSDFGYADYAKNILKYGIMIQRVNISNKLAISESVSFSNINKQETQILFDSAKRKNFYWEFKLKPIDDFY